MNIVMNLNYDLIQKFLLISISILIPVIVICIIIVKLGKNRKYMRQKNILEGSNKTKLSPAVMENQENGVIIINDSGFSVVFHDKKKECNLEVKWDKIDEIKAYKRDLFTVDLICWQFHDFKLDRFIEVNEEMAGFHELSKAVNTRFSVEESHCFTKVALPPFDNNMTVIWPNEKTVNKPIKPSS